MSTDVKSKKRKSGDNVVPAAKKAKTVTATPVEKPAPLKSALKKSKSEAPAAAVEKPAKKAAAKKAPAAKSAKTKKAETVDVEEAAAVAPTDEDEEDGTTELTADQTAALLAGFSSDEEEEEPEDAGLDIASLPAPPIEKKKKGGKQNADGDSETTPGTIYIGRLPHGFYERQLRAYFTQFGQIINLRLSRNKRTGKSQHHAFVEFASAAVAEIVAKTMDKYLMFGHILQVRRVPSEQVNEKMWKSGLKSGRVMPRNRIERSRLRRGAEREQWEKRVEAEERRRKDKSEKLKEIGYEFEMPAVKKVSEVAVKPKAKAIEAADDEAEKVEQVTKIVEAGDEVTEKVTKSVETKADSVKTTVEKTVKRKNKAVEAPSTKKSKKVKAAA